MGGLVYPRGDNWMRSVCIVARALSGFRGWGRGRGWGRVRRRGRGRGWG